MYHSIILEDLLDILNLSHTYGQPPGLRWTTQLPPDIARMRYWLSAMTHPDGQIAFFNDAALGIAIPPSGLESYAQRLGLGSVAAPTDRLVHLAASGYVRLQCGPSVLLADVGRVGPDFQPGHAHADTLSFEWSLGQQRIVVNSGTSCYGLGAERERQRGTAAHSTVEVDGQNSSEVWSGFRVARLALPGPVELHDSGDTLRVTGSHNGYQRLPGRVNHQRQWDLTADSLWIKDTLSGEFTEAMARFYLHPQVTQDTPTDPAELRWRTPEGWRLAARVEGGQPECVPGTYHPRFDVSRPNSCCQSRFRQPHHAFHIRWFDPK